MDARKARRLDLLCELHRTETKSISVTVEVAEGRIGGVDGKQQFVVLRSEHLVGDERRERKSFAIYEKELRLVGEALLAAAQRFRGEQMRDCEAAGCDRPARHRRYCDCHAKRAQRGADMSKPAQEKLTPFARFVEACIGLADAPAEDDPAFDRALDVVRKAACTWMRSMGWRPEEQDRSAERGAA